MPRVINGSSATAHGLRSLTRARVGPISSCSALRGPPVWRSVRLYADKEADARRTSPSLDGAQVASAQRPGGAEMSDEQRTPQRLATWREKRRRKPPRK